MTQEIEAVFQRGVFRPLGTVLVREDEKVVLNIRSVGRQDPLSWLREIDQLHQRILSERGPFPDSTPEIAADRQRDE